MHLKFYLRKLVIDLFMVPEFALKDPIHMFRLVIISSALLSKLVQKLHEWAKGLV